MSQLVAIFCDLDDFCKVFEPLYEQRLLAKAATHRRRQRALSLSEIMTLVIDFHRRHYRDFKAYYLLQLMFKGLVASPDHFSESRHRRRSEGIALVPERLAHDGLASHETDQRSPH